MTHRDPLRSLVMKGESGSIELVFVLFAGHNQGLRRRDRCVMALIRWCASGRFGHVAVAARGRVLNPLACGDRWFDLGQYVSRYPGLAAAVVIPVRRSPDLTRWAMTRRRVWPSLVRWATRGRTPAEDCVCTTGSVLRSVGVPVPTRIVTPDELHAWLVREGYPHAKAVAP